VNFWISLTNFDVQTSGLGVHTPTRYLFELKINRELATELDFSVSTVGHETMRIYQALAVSDRKEAVKQPLVLGIF
jgi:hypothetical protein